MKTMKRRLGVKDKKILKIHTSKVAFFIPFYMKTIKRGLGVKDKKILRIHTSKVAFLSLFF